jgi:hypothetical protein
VPVSGENVDHLRLKWITPVAFRPFFRRHLMIHITFYILAHKSSAITNKHHCKQLEGLNRGLRQDVDQMIFQNGQVFFYSAGNFTRDIFYWRPAKFISEITKIFFDVKTDQQNPTSFLP